MRQTTNKNLTKQILTLMLAFVMVFTGMGIGSWGVDAAWAHDGDSAAVVLTDDNGKSYTAVEKSSIKAINAKVGSDTFVVTIKEKCYVVDVPADVGFTVQSNLSQEWYELYNGTKLALTGGNISVNKHSDEEYNTGEKLCTDDGVKLFIITDINSSPNDLVNYAIILRVGAVKSAPSVNLTDDNGELHEAVADPDIKIISWANGPQLPVQHCYVVDVPADSDFTINSNIETKWKNLSTLSGLVDNKILDSAIKNLTFTFTVGKDLRTNAEGKDIKLFVITDEGVSPSNLNIKYAVVLRVGAAASIAVDKTALAEQITEAQALHESKYYITDDRYNGKTESKNGFWTDFQTALTNAVRINENSKRQKEIDAAAEALKKAKADIISKDHINPTALYESLTRTYVRNFAGIFPGRWYDEGPNEYLNIREANETEASWKPYGDALEAGHAFLDSMYDENGIASGKNNAAAIADCESKLNTLDETRQRLVDKKSYDSAYQTFTNRMDEAVGLLNQYGPAKFGSDEEGGYDSAKCPFTEDSWTAYVDAYKTLKTATQYKIKSSVTYPKGGSYEDYTAIKDFAKQIDDFREKLNALVSARDIEVEVSYVNNSAARYPQIKTSGTDIYYRKKLPLTSGNTTIHGILEQAGISFDDEPKQYTIVQDGKKQSKNSIGINLMIFVDGECRGIYAYKDSNRGSDIPLQLHDGEKVSIVRIPSGFSVEEASSGYDSTEKFYELTRSIDKMGDSIGQISIDSITPDIKVGDVVNIKTSAKGAYVTNKGQDLSAENLALFVSGKASEKSDILSVKDLQKTTAVTDQEGNAEYVFREPGWYTIALFDLQEETPEFTDVYSAVTKGSYPGAKAGAYMQVYVAPAGNENAVLEKWRKNNLAEAKALYETYNDAALIKEYGNYSFDTDEDFNAFKTAYETLKNNQEAEQTKSLKELMEAYDRDLAVMNTYAAKARDHEVLVQNVKTPLSYLPETAEEVTYPYKNLFQQMKTAYETLNTYEVKELLSPAEQAKIELLLKNVGDIAAPEKTPIQISAAEDLQAAYGGHNEEYYTPDYDSPWQNHVYNTDPTGKESRTYVKYGTTSWGLEPSYEKMGAYLGDRVVIDRLIHQSDSIYWMMYSLDDGKTWTLAENHWKDSVDSVLMRAEFAMPETKASTLTVQLKGISKTEYEKLTAEIEKLTEEERAEIKAAIQAAYDSYDLTKYDDAGKEALKTALNDGLAALTKAVTKQDAANARKAALAAMAAVAQVKQGGDSPTIIEPSYNSGKTVGRVYITIENSKCLTTETSSDKGHGTVFNTKDAGLYGAFIEGWYDLGKNDTMMTCILKALEMNGYGWEGTGGEGKGYSITYISGIFKDKNRNGKWDAADEKILSEFDGGQKSGWMGTQNDWFNNESFAMFSVANGKLENGDELHLMYTADYGEDIGGSWNNGSTELKSLTAEGGTLSPSFSASQKEYTLLIAGGTKSVKLTPTAANKNYQVRIFLNDYNKESARYKRTESISVKAGDILYVGVGESGWATMNSTSKGTKYTIKVVSSADADSVKAMLNALKSITYNNYKAEKTAVETARAAYNAMDAAGKAKVTADELKKLSDAEAEIKFYSEIDDAKDKLGTLTDSSSSSQAKAALSAYEKLSEKQRQYITEDEVKKFNELAKKYNLSTITGSAEMPESEVVTEGKAGSAITNSPTTVKMSGTTASVTVKADNQKEILKQAKEKKSVQVVLVVADSDAKGAEKFEMNLEKSLLEALLKDTNAKLVVKTPLGQKTYERDELQKLVNETTGTTVKAEINKDNVDAQTEEPIDDNAAKIEKAKSIVKDMKLTARSSKTAKKNIKAVLKSDAKVNASIKELKDLGFTVKYRFYRSTKKAASYKSTVTKKTASYTNTSGKKGTKYFYKVQVRVYDENGKLVAKTALKQCKYASRTWSK